VSASQRPIELILARSLLSNLTTPGFLVDEEGRLIFYNEAAGELLGLRFEEAGLMESKDWGNRFGPFGDDGEPIPIDDLPLTIALREGRPSHAHFSIHSARDGIVHSIQVSAFPIMGSNGRRGAMAIFWPDEESG